MALWNQFRSILFGGAIGAAARTAIEPQIEPARQLAWDNNRNRILGLGDLARLVAQGRIPPGAAAEEAGRNGYNANRVAAAVTLAQHAPESGQLMEMIDRGTISGEQIDHALAKAQIEPQYWAAIKDLANNKLSPAELANAIQQGHLPNAGILPTPKSGDLPYSIPLTQIDIDPVEEVQAAGLDRERLQVLTNLAGLPPGDIELLQMWNRGIIDEASVDAGIREGHRKTKWIPAVKELRHSVLSAQEYASARLRQWITADESYKGGALTGHNKAQMDLLFLNRGRPASPTQMWRAWARGAKGPRGVPASYEDHAKAIAISDIRPEYAELLWEIRFNYPPLFQLNRMVAGGVIDADTAASWAHKALVAPEVVEALRKLWAQPQGAAAQKWADRARTRLYTVTHNEFLQGSIDEDTARSKLMAIGVSETEQFTVITLWKSEAEISRVELTATQIRKAYHNAAPGYTREVSLLELIQRGMTPDDAVTFLDYSAEKG